MTRRHAFILPVVLVVIGLLSLTMAGFMFFVRAELAGMQAERDAQQARLTADSGLEEVITVLRASSDDVSTWYDVPDRFRHALVWAQTYDRSEDPIRQGVSRRDFLEDDVVSPAWRFSVVAPNFDGLPDTFRYGVTPEASKLNLNAASEDEIRRLVEPLLMDLQIDNSLDLVDALLDWLDADDEMRPNGAESEYYTMDVEPGYYPKNGPLDTVEELLLIKGFSAAILYGEDTNRNGVLDPNEDDGDESFPYYDNGDGILNHGLAPFVTVWSREVSVGEDGQSQVREGLVNVNTAPRRVLEALDGMTSEALEQIIAVRQELEPEALQDAEWVMQSGAVDPGTYDAIKDRITTNALQFHVEVLGYADHLKLARRYEWIVEMRGTLAQVVYTRELTSLGFAWRVDDDTFVIEQQ